MMTTLQGRVADAIKHATKGITTGTLARSLGADASKVSASCGELRARGWVRSELRPSLHHSRPIAWWYPTPKLRTEPYREQAHTPGVAAAILAVLSPTDAVSARTLAEQTGLPLRSVRHAVGNLVRAGTLERVGTDRYGYPLDDDGWTPQPYINPIRARALGLPCLR
jgi:DNA-binding MarR family transcriptional regulator